MYDSTITLFNWHKGTGLWYPTVITNVDVTEVQGDNNTTQGNTNADNVELLINCTGDKSIKCENGGTKGYTAPKEFANCSDPEERFTFNTDKDFVYIGNYPDSAPIADDTGFDSGFYQEMNNRYDGVYKINSVAFYGLLPHFEVGGR